jgi:hypothetical protein
VDPRPRPSCVVTWRSEAYESVEALSQTPKAYCHDVFLQRGVSCVGLRMGRLAQGGSTYLCFQKAKLQIQVVDQTLMLYAGGLRYIDIVP